MADTTTTDTPDLVASTGVNDPNSPWNGLLVTALSDVSQLGTNALTHALSSQTPVSSSTGGAGLPISPASSAPQSAAAMPHSNTTLWIVGGLALLVVGWFLFRH